MGQLLRIVRLLERLGREADVLPDVLGGPPAAPRDLAPAGFPVRVQTPEEAHERCDAALHQHEARVGNRSNTP